MYLGVSCAESEENYMFGLRFRFWLTAAIVGMFVSCSDVAFRNDPSFNRCQNFNQDCVTVDGEDHFDYQVCSGNEKVDILFVDDNSASMYTEQTKMGDKFPDFADALSGLDFQIGITTTDLAQGGSLLPFPNGSTVLHPTMANYQNLFLQGPGVSYG